MIKTREELDTLALHEIGKSLKKSLTNKVRVPGLSLENLVEMALSQFTKDLERGDLDFGFWERHGFTTYEAAKDIETALNDFFRLDSEYSLNLILPYERLRSCAQKKIVPTCRAYAGRPRVIFSLVVHGLQLVDPNNLIFELQGEASVGVPLPHAVEYLGMTASKESYFEALDAKVSHDGILHFQDADKEKRVRSLLKIRMRGGKLEESYSYFRYGIASHNIWLIQEFSAYFYLSADFKSLPFDDFSVEADFNVGFGGDVVNVELVTEAEKAETEAETDKPSLEKMFSKGFDAGEFHADKENASLDPIGYLHDPTHFVDNVIRLKFRVRRSPRNIMLRIGLPLFLMAALLLVGSWYAVEQMESQVIPAVLVAMVALQLTAVQGMPRDARFSVLDRCFVASYLLAVILFLLPLISDCWPQWVRRLVVDGCALSYVASLTSILCRPWIKQRSSSE